MNFDFFLLLPELTVVAMVTFLALLEIGFPLFSQRYSARLNGFGIALTAVSLAIALQRPGNAFGGMFVNDPLGIDIEKSGTFLSQIRHCKSPPRDSWR